MSITATELKNNLGKYLLLSAKEDIFITKNGKIVAKLTNPHQDRVEVAKSLFGILPKDADLNEAIWQTCSFIMSLMNGCRVTIQRFRSSVMLMTPSVTAYRRSKPSS